MEPEAWRRAGRWAGRRAGEKGLQGGGRGERRKGSGGGEGNAPERGLCRGARRMAEARSGHRGLGEERSAVHCVGRLAGVGMSGMRV